MSRPHRPTDDGQESADSTGQRTQPRRHTETYRRQNCVVIRPDSPLDEFRTAPPETLATAVRDIMGELNSGQLLELWHYASGAGTLDTMLTGYGEIDTTSPTRFQTTLSEYDRSSLSRPASGGEELLDVLATTANRHVGDAADVFTCDLDLSTMGRQPVTTSRLVVPPNNQPTYPGNLHHQPVAEMLYDLKQRAVPFVYQVLLEKDTGSSFYVSGRLAVFDLSVSATDASDFGRLAEEPYPYDLARYFDVANLTSSLQFPAEDYFVHLSRRHGATSTRDHVSESEADRVRDIVLGRAEYDRLLEGTMGYDQVYTSALGYPKIPIDPNKLANFVTLASTGYESYPWKEVTYREAPRVLSKTPAMSDPVPQRPAPELSTAEDSAFGTVSNDGSPEHEGLLQDGIRELGEMGYDFERVEQTTESIPDAVGTTPDGDPIWLEAEKSNVDKAANYLINVARARREGVEVAIVVEGKSEARRVAENLRYPVNDHTSDGTLLYNQSDHIHLDEGVIAVLPRDASRSYWYVTEEHDLVLRAGGTVVARGPMDESVKTFDYDCPRYSVDDDSHVVTASNGEQLDRYDTKGELTDEWSLARVPHVPIAFSYTTGVSIWYQHVDRLERFTESPEWALDGNEDRYAEAAATFAERYFVEASDEQLFTDDAHTVFEDWYDSQTDKKSPNKTWWMRGMPDDRYGTKQAGEDGGDGQAFKDLTWAFPPDPEAPDLPVFDDDILGDLGLER
jgi:hypothetical protein